MCFFCDGRVESPMLQFFEDTSDAALVRWNREQLPPRFSQQRA